MSENVAHEFTENVYKELLTAMDDFSVIVKANREEQAEIDSGDYSQQYVTKLLNDIRDRNRMSENKKHELKNKISEMVSAFVRENRPCLNPDDITDDTKLLNAGVKLTSDEIDALLVKNHGNYTMTEILLRYARERNIKTSIVGNVDGSQTKLLIDETARTALGTTDYFMKWIDTDKAIRMLSGYYGVSQESSIMTLASLKGIRNPDEIRKLAKKYGVVLSDV